VKTGENFRRISRRRRESSEYAVRAQSRDVVCFRILFSPHPAVHDSDPRACLYSFMFLFVILLLASLHCE